MQDGMKSLARAAGWIARLALWIAGVGLVLMTVIIFAQVFVRYFMNDSLQWAEPAAVMIMAWFIFLGAAVGLREGYHLSFDVLLVFLPDRAAPWLHTISDVVVGAFGFGMTWFGLELAEKASRDMVPGLGITRFYDFLPLMIGGALIILFSVERVLRRLAGLPTARFGDVDPESEDLAEQTGTGA